MKGMLERKRRVRENKCKSEEENDRRGGVRGNEGNRIRRNVART